MRRPQHRSSPRLLALAAGLAWTVSGCVVPPHAALHDCPRIVRFPCLEEHSHAGAPCSDRVVWGHELAPAEVVPGPCPIAVADRSLAVEEQHAFGDPSEVESAAFTQFGRPPRFLPVPTAPVFGPR